MMMIANHDRVDSCLHTIVRMLYTLLNQQESIVRLIPETSAFLEMRVMQKV